MRDPRLTTFAKANRKEMPEPATRIWLQLRASRFMGIKFRREKVIGEYIADFASNDPKLVIEIDGGHSRRGLFARQAQNYLSGSAGLPSAAIHKC